MAIYETMVIIDPRMEAQGLDEQLDKIKSFVETNDGSMHTIERVGRRRLAYDIGGHGEGYYAVLHFESDPAQIAPLQRSLRLNELVLRHIVIKRDKFPEGPTMEPVRSEEPVAAAPVEAAPPAPAPEPAAPAEEPAAAPETAPEEATAEAAPAEETPEATGEEEQKSED